MLEHARFKDPGCFGRAFKIRPLSKASSFRALHKTTGNNTHVVHNDVTVLQLVPSSRSSRLSS